jgi:hypothetical protein
MHGLDVDSIVNDHIQPIFFLDDADDAEIDAHLDAIIAAIRANMKRHALYLRNPTTQLQREILQHSMSIATAENCTNAPIQRIIQIFKADVKYDAITFNDIAYECTIDDINEIDTLHESSPDKTDITPESSYDETDTTSLDGRTCNCSTIISMQSPTWTQQRKVMR